MQFIFSCLTDLFHSHLSTEIQIFFRNLLLEIRISDLKILSIFEKNKLRVFFFFGGVRSFCHENYEFRILQNLINFQEGGVRASVNLCSLYNNKNMGKITKISHFRILAIKQECKLKIICRREN